MKKLIVSIFAVSTLFVSSILAENEIFYMQAAAGINTVKDQNVDRHIQVGAIGIDRPSQMEWKNGSVTSLTAGYILDDTFNVELEVTKRKNDLDKFVYQSSIMNSANGTLSSTSIMINGIYKFKTVGILTPYTGIGIGKSLMNLDFTDSLASGSDDNWAFAAQATLGTTVEINSTWDIIAQYQYFMVNDVSIAESHTVGTSTNTLRIHDYHSHSVSLGVRYNF